MKRARLSRRERLLAISVSAVLILYLYVGLVFTPLNRRNHLLDEEVSVATTNVELWSRSLLESKQLLERHRNFKTLDQSARTKRSSIGLVATVQDQASGLLDLEMLRPLESGSPQNEIGVICEGYASEQSIWAFLGSLLEDAPYLSIAEMRLRNAGNSGSRLRFSLWIDGRGNQ